MAGTDDRLLACVECARGLVPSQVAEARATAFALQSCVAPHDLHAHILFSPVPMGATAHMCSRLSP